jgi:hypothetical protein
MGEPRPVVRDCRGVRLHGEGTDAAGLAEMLQFLSDWLARDRDHLEASLEGFVGSPAYGTRQLSDDMDRFIFLLGGSDGEPLFDSEPQ